MTRFYINLLDGDIQRVSIKSQSNSEYIQCCFHRKELGLQDLTLKNRISIIQFWLKQKKIMNEESLREYFMQYGPWEDLYGDFTWINRRENLHNDEGPAKITQLSQCFYFKDNKYHRTDGEAYSSQESSQSNNFYILDQRIKP